MATPLDTPSQSSEKCKPIPLFSRPWMSEFLVDALKTADVPGALKRAEMDVGDYLQGRRSDPAFETACLEIDLIVRQALMVTLESQAARGDQKAIKLLAGGLTEIRKILAANEVAISDRAGGGFDVDALEFPADGHVLRMVIRRYYGEAHFARFVRGLLHEVPGNPSSGEFYLNPALRERHAGPCVKCNEGIRLHCPQCSHHLVVRPWNTTRSDVWAIREHAQASELIAYHDWHEVHGKSANRATESGGDRVTRWPDERETWRPLAEPPPDREHWRWELVLPKCKPDGEAVWRWKSDSEMPAHSVETWPSEEGRTWFQGHDLAGKPAWKREPLPPEGWVEIDPDAKGKRGKRP